MKKRWISGLILAIIMVVIGFANKPLVDTMAVTAISLIGIYEFNKAFKHAGFKPISWIGYFSCFAMFITGGIIQEANKIMILKIAVPALLIIIFMYMILTRFKRTVVDVAITVFSLVYIPFMFSFIKLILDMPHGRFLIIYVLMAAFVSDTFAYLVGSKFGKNKLCPDISPNKTIEGSIGGIVGVVLFFVILTLIGKYCLMIDLNMWFMLVAGLISGIAGQFGDLAASGIKRYCQIKDFGNIIPGHGGLLDRFDSLLFVAPVMYIFLKLYIL